MEKEMFLVKTRRHESEVRVRQMHFSPIKCPITILTVRLEGGRVGVISYSPFYRVSHPSDRLRMRRI